MKASFITALLCFTGTVIYAQNAAFPVQVQDTGAGLKKIKPTVIQRDANTQIWRSETYEQGPDGVAVTNVHQYTEIASGLNHLVNGEWVESTDRIDILPDGSAAATNGLHQAYFPGDIYSGAITLVTPNGNRLISRPLGLSYFDGTNSVLIAELTNSVGVVIGDNEVVYSNAFNGVSADLKYEYTKAGFSQDVILRRQPFTPEYFGLNPATARLQMLTEFLNSPQPTVASQSQLTQAGVTLIDRTLDFGGLQMVQGHAFLFGNSANDGGASVSKSWNVINGRQILIEEVPVEALVKELLQLPTAQAAIAGTNTLSPLNIVSAKHLLPVPRVAQKDVHRLKFARLASESQPGLVLDYQTITSQANYTFQGDTTYLVSGTVNLSGTTVIEGGAVIKYTNDVSAMLNVTGTLTNKTAPYRPAIFTSQDDNSVGEQIAGSSGSPPVPPSSTTTGLKFSAAQTVSNMRFDYFNRAIDFEGNFGASLTLSDIQFVYDNVGVFSSLAIPPSVKGDNILMVNLSYGFAAQDETAAMVNLTAYNVSTLANYTNSGSSSFNATNCIIVNSATAAWMTGAYNAFYSSTAFGSSSISLSGNPFETVGAGQCYLINQCVARNAGTTNVSSTLLNDLKAKTTFPPILYSNTVVSLNTTLGPQAQRDRDVPDLGYHYDPIDYLVDAFWVTNATLTVAPGTAIARYNDSGIILTDGSAISSLGIATSPIWYTKYDCVQEQPVLRGSYPDNGLCINPFHSTTAPTGQYRFCKFSTTASGGDQLYHFTQWGYSSLAVEDCEFWNGANNLAGGNGTTASLKNNLFARSVISANALGYANNSLIASNNLFWNMTVAVLSGANSNNWNFFNNSFDNVSITGLGIQQTVNGYNAYLVNTNRLKPAGATDVVSTNLTVYQTGPLGYFYQPTNSILINTGSVTADLTSLYHYTTTANQVKETNSIVDIGYHYVAVDSSGNPIDSDGDGVPDYLEDANGNGSLDSGETDWLNASDTGLRVFITRPRDGSILP